MVEKTKAEKQALELAEIVATEVKAGDWQVIVQAAVEQAKSGDAKARTWLTEQIALTEEDLAEMLREAGSLKWMGDAVRSGRQQKLARD